MVDFNPETAKKYLGRDEFKLYQLIYNRFIASQMSDAKFEVQTVTFKGDRSIFKATGKRLMFDGFYRVLGMEIGIDFYQNLSLIAQLS